METMNAEIVVKIQKLLALAENNGATEAEAVTAMAMAQKLLEKYNLDLYTVQQTASAVKPAAEKREKTTIDNLSAQYQWQRSLWDAIATSNFCWYWTAVVQAESRFIKKTIKAKRHRILGSETNVIAVRIMGEYLTSTIERLVRAEYPKSELLSRSAISWREGCADRLVSRIHDAKREREREAEQTAQRAAAQGSTAITIMDVAKSEHAKNYDAVNGAGAWAALQRNRIKWENRLKDEENKRAIMLAKETPEERTIRLAQERLAAERVAKAYSRRTGAGSRGGTSHIKSRDIDAYYRGADAGSKISLNKQVSEGNSKRRLG